MTAVPPTALETRRVVVLSTGHLSEETLRLLRTAPPESWPVSGGRIAFGFYIYAHDEMPDGVEADLARCLHTARAWGFDYVQFDEDAEPLDCTELPVSS